ncbi:jagged 1-like, partial [Mytilus galloprovincialis]
SSVTSISSAFQFIDEESGLDHFKIQIYQLRDGIRSQIIPDIHGDWMDIGNNITRTSYTLEGLTLHQGALYSTRVGAVNKAGFVAAFETDGVIVDTTPPIV